MARHNRLPLNGNSLVYIIGLACLLVGWPWHNGWLEGSTDNEKAIGGGSNATHVYRNRFIEDLDKADNLVKAYVGMPSSWLANRRHSRIRAGGGDRSRTGPFSTFSCFGEGADVAGIYTKPFKFHVYTNLPKEYLEETMLNASAYWAPDHSNNQFVTETRLVDDLTMHPCHTLDVDDADAFIVPIQTVSTIWLQKEQGVADGGRRVFTKIMRWLETQPAYARSQGRDHYAMGIPWDTTRRPFGDLSLFGPETPTDYDNVTSFGFGKYMHAVQDIVIPYPDPDSVQWYTEERLKTIKRNKLAVFAGSMIKKSPVREIVAKQMKAYNTRKGSTRAVWQYIDHNTNITLVKDLLPTATFGPVMEGDSYSSRRLFSLISAGTIPVILCDKLMLPYEEFLDYSSFVVFVSEKELLEKSDFDLFDLLEEIPKEEVRRLQANGRAVKKHFTFHTGDIVPGDAFDMFVRSLAAVSYRQRGLKNMIKRASYTTT